MKKFFLLGIVGIALAFAVLYFIYRIILAIIDVWEDWRFGKELKKIERDSAARRAQQRAERRAGQNSPAAATPAGHGEIQIRPTDSDDAA